jgi:alkylation response protein AidB-like acyl-CoA dehydrogenase
MKYLLKLLRSFHEKEDKAAIDRFVELLNDQVIPQYVELSEKGVRIKEGKAVFPQPWKSIKDNLGKIGFFKSFVPPEYGGVKTSEESLYSYMELLGYSCPSIGIQTPDRTLARYSSLRTDRGATTASMDRSGLSPMPGWPLSIQSL